MSLSDGRLAAIEEVPLLGDVTDLLAEVRRLRADRTEEQKSRRVIARIGCICEPCIESGPDDEDCWSCAQKVEITILRSALEAAAARFREYERMHRERVDGARAALDTATPSERRALAASIEHRSEKADSNAAMAEACERALKGEP